jgi:tripartite-type tricarboxylate transporter receptor subunit TctC
MNRFRIGAAFAAASILTLFGSAAQAEEFGETKPVKIVVVTAPGGAQDRVARLFAEQLQKRVKQPVVVENRPGGATRIAADYARSQPADGHTILQHSTTFTFLPQYFPDAKLNPNVDFIPLAGLTETVLAIMVPGASPHRTLQDLVKGMKAKPEAYSWGVSFTGSFDHLVAVDFLRRAGAETTFVGYKGEAPMTVDFLANRTQVIDQGLAGYKQHIANGAARPLAVSGRARDAEWPQLPTIAEQGYPGYNAGVWYGWFVPAGTPNDTVVKLTRMLEEIKADPEVVAKVQGFNNTVYPPGRAEFAEQVQRDTQRWGALIKEMGFKPQ